MWYQTIWKNVSEKCFKDWQKFEDSVQKQQRRTVWWTRKQHVDHMLLFPRSLEPLNRSYCKHAFLDTRGSGVIIYGSRIFHEKFSDFQARTHAPCEQLCATCVHAFTLSHSTHDLSRLPDEKKIFVSWFPQLSPMPAA